MERKKKQFVFYPKNVEQKESQKLKLRDLVANFARDGKEIIADKGKMVSSEVRQKRLDVCKECEHLKGSGGQIRCMHPKCGCFMAIKAGFRKAKCPLDKWGEQKS